MKGIKKIIGIFIIAICGIIFAPNSVFADSVWYSSGTGTSADPYIISNYDQLNEFASVVNAGTVTTTSNYYKLSSDFGKGTGTSESLTTPIGDYYHNFDGNFDGNNKTVTLNINVSVRAGMFGATQTNSYISNVNVTGTAHATGNGAGGIVGGTNKGVIDSCFSINANISAGVEYAGGIAGGNNGSSAIIKNSGSINSRIAATAQDAGGISADNDNGAKIVNCFSSSKVNTGLYGGGIVGQFVHGTVANCYSTSTNDEGFATLYSIAGRSPYAPNVINSFYLYGSATPNSGSGTYTVDESTSLSEENMKATSGDDALVTKLNNYVVSNSGEGYKTWVALGGNYPTFLGNNEITTVIATTTPTVSGPTYGGTVNHDVTFNVTSSSVVTIQKGQWKKYNTNAYTPYTNTVFSEGKYRYETKILVANDSGYELASANNLTVIIDGVEWTKLGMTNVGSLSSYILIASPSYDVAEVSNELSFTSSSAYNISESTVGTAIDSFTVKDGAMGGTKPYTFTKTSGPDWLTVSNDGNISGTPVNAGTNENLVVRVTDANNDYKEISLTVANTVGNSGTSYTVSFDTNGGSTIASQNITSGNKATEPTAPTKSGYVFAGWYSDSGLTHEFDFNTSITAGITLYAKWNVLITSANVTITVPIKGANPTYTVTSSDNTKYTANVSRWVLHESGTTSTVYSTDEFASGKQYAVGIEFVAKEGYAFNDSTVFTINGNETTSYSTIRDREYIFTVSDVSTYKVVFNANGGFGSMSNVAGLTGTYTLPSSDFLPPTGKNFKGWSLTTDGAVITSLDMTEDKIVYAIWVDISVTSYTVDFDTNGGSSVTSQNITSGDKATEPTAPTKEGYVFAGWYSDSGLTHEFDFNTSITAGITLYAKWGTAPATYTYTIISGDNKNFTKGEADSYVIKIDGDYSKFESFVITGLTLVKDTDYTVTEGSTIITLTATGLDKVKTLAAGDYTFTVKYNNDKTVNGSLKVTETSTDDSNTNTDNNTDDSNTNTDNNNTDDSNSNTNNTDSNTNITNNPQTSDNIISYIISLISGIVCLAGGTIYLNRKRLFANR